MPFKGGGPAIADVMAGHTQIYLGTLVTVMPFINGGRLRLLALGGNKRNPNLPNVPTIAEQGLPGFEMDVWFGTWAPAATPRPVLQKLAADLRHAMDAREVREQYGKLGIEPSTLSLDEFARFVRVEMKKYADVVKRADIQPM